MLDYCIMNAVVINKLIPIPSQPAFAQATFNLFRDNNDKQKNKNKSFHEKYSSIYY